MDVQLPDGTVVQGIPDGTTRAQLAEKLKANGRNVPAEWLSPTKQPAPIPNLMRRIIGGDFSTPMASAYYDKKKQWGMGESQAAYEAGGKATDIASKMGASPEVAGAVGYGTNVAAQAVPALFGGQAAPKAITQAGAATAKALSPSNPEVIALARKAHALDIPLRPDMLTDNRFFRMMGEALEKVPLSASKAEQRQIAFNRAVGATIGASKDAERLTPAVFSAAMSKSGKTIGDIAEKTPIPMDSTFGTALSQRVLQAKRFETADVAKIIKNYADDLRNASKTDGNIPGEQFRKITSQIGAQRRGTTNGDLKRALGTMEDELHEALLKNVKDPADIAKLAEAKKQYAIGKTIEPLVAKNDVGNISPARLMSAVTSTSSKKAMMARGSAGDIGDIARIGQAFLKEQSSSGTVERAVSYGLLGGTGFAHLPTAAGVWSLANLYNRAAPHMVPKSPGILPSELLRNP